MNNSNPHHQQYRTRILAALAATASLALAGLSASPAIAAPASDVASTTTVHAVEPTTAAATARATRNSHHGPKHGHQHHAHHAHQGHGGKGPKHHHGPKHGHQHHAHHGHGPKGGVSLEARAMKVAVAQIGDPYVYGAAGPNAFDCSGLTSYAFARAGKHLPRSSAAQVSATRRISAGAARRGDLVFFHGSSGIYHVAFYAGHGTVLHAPYPGQRVRYERLWTSAVTYGRVK